MLKLTTKNIALISVFATLIVIVTRIPGIPIFGGGGHIEFSVILYPVIGIMLGPWMGFAAAFLGNFIAWIIPTSTVFGLLTIPAGAIAAFVGGCMSQGSGKLNWKAAAIILAMLDALWYLTPVGLEAPFYPILHVAALVLILLFRERISEYMHSSLRNTIVLGTALCSYTAVMADHMFGSLVYVSSIGWVIPLKAVRDAINAWGIISMKLGFSVPTGSLGDIFMLILPISAVERIIYTAVATFLGVSLIRIIGWKR
ncbi:MAG: ECF transporter S component [Candidatus Bathyarchaeota archaeon]